ncbi:hypothetical protein CsSME_00047708 [Camellia sinensis var. sinensis]
MPNLTGTPKIEISFSSLLELAADNDIEGFKQSILCIASSINETGLWYCRQRASKQMVLEYRTPLMVAAMYGSVDVVKLILSLSEADVNLSCGPDKSTALHCAASSGSVNVIDVVKLLLFAGADCNSIDANGHRPIDVIVAPLKFPYLKDALEELLRNDDYVHLPDMKVSLSVICMHLLHQRRKNIQLILLFQTSRTVSILLMNFECSRLRSGLVLEPILMIGLSALLFIRVRMPEEEIQESFITVVCLVQIFVRGNADVGTCVSMLMGFLSAGCTQHSIGPASAKMAQVALVGSASLLTHLRNSGRYTCLQGRLFHPPDRPLLLLLSWIWLWH